MGIQELKENPRLTDPAWNEWWSKYLRHRVIGTQRAYIKYLCDFLEWIDSDTESLFNRYSEEEQMKDTRGYETIQSQFIDYAYELKDKGIKSKIHHTRSALSSFFNANGKENFKIKTGDKTLFKLRKTGGKERFNKQQIELMLEACRNSRDKSLIVTLRDSLLRPVDVTNLKIKNILPALDQDFYCFELIQDKTDQPAKPILGHEAIYYLKHWLAERERLGLGRDPDDWLYVQLDSRNDRMGGKITEQGVSDAIQKVRDRTQLDQKKYSAYSIRKFTRTMLEASDMHQNWIYEIEGRIGDSSGHYSKPTTEQLIEAYKKAYPSISITDKTTPETVRQLENENEELRKRIQDIENDHQRKEETRAQRLEQIENTVEAVLKTIQQRNIDLTNLRKQIEEQQ